MRRSIGDARDDPAGDPDPMADLLAGGHDFPDADSAQSRRRLRWSLIALLSCLAWGLGFSVVLGVEVGLSQFEPTLSGMLNNHPIFGALLFLAEPAFATYYVLGPWAGLLLGVPVGRLVAGTVVATFMFPLAVVEAAVIVSLVGLCSRIATVLRRHHSGT